jgi:hypothetical protein
MAVDERFAEEVRGFLSDKGCKGTKKVYNSKCRRWDGYIELVGNVDRFLEGMSKVEKQRFWVRFIIYLDGLGVKEHALKEHLAAVKDMLSTSAFNMDMDFADSTKCAFLKRVINASRYTEVEKAERDARACARASIPLPDDVALHLRKTLWEESGTSVVGLGKKSMWVAIAIMLLRGSRISNCAETDADHAIKVGNVTIYYSTSTLSVATYKGGDAWPEELTKESAFKVDLRFVSSKDSPETKPISVEKTEDKWAAMGVSTITEWLRIQSGYHDISDLVTTSYSFQPDPQCRQRNILKPTLLIPKKFNAAIKDGAEYFGLNRNHFSSRSFRKRMGTLVNEGRLSGIMADLIGGWSTGSQTRVKNYTVGSIKYVGIGDEEAISLDMARDMITSHGQRVTVQKRVSINAVPTTFGM